VFIETPQGPFLVTAAHAIRRRHGSGLLTRGRKKLVVIDGRTTATKADVNDPYDLAAIRISTAFIREHGIEVVPESIFVTRYRVENPQSRAISGYPLAKNKRARVDRNAKVINLRMYSFFGPANFDFDYARFKKDPAYHIGLRYESPGTDNDGRVLSRLPSPRGMSGGGLWLIPDFTVSDQIFLEGIFFECHKDRFAFATHLKHVLGFIHESHLLAT
jgi:hypothetical protein